MRILAITGAPGSGKTTLADLLLQNASIAKLRPYTSRPRRSDETLLDYHFFSEREAASRESQSLFWDELFGFRYGLLLSELRKPATLASLTLPTWRVADLRRAAEVVHVHLRIDPPRLIEERLSSRNDDASQFKARLAHAIRENSAPANAELVLVNGSPDHNLERVVQSVILA